MTLASSCMVVVLVLAGQEQSPAPAGASTNAPAQECARAGAVEMPVTTSSILPLSNAELETRMEGRADVMAELSSPVPTVVSAAGLALLLVAVPLLAMTIPASMLLGAVGLLWMDGMLQRVAAQPDLRQDSALFLVAGSLTLSLLFPSVSGMMAMPAAVVGTAGVVAWRGGFLLRQVRVRAAMARGDSASCAR